MAKYLVTKKQVNEMYLTVVNDWRSYREDVSLIIYKDSDKKTQWTFDNKEGLSTIYKIEDATYLFEWVILKEIGGRKKMSKAEIINGIQWNISNNYNKVAS